MKVDIPIYTYDKKKRRRVRAGTIRGNEFLKRVNIRHMMRIVDGFGISREVVDDLLKRKTVDVVVIFDRKKAYSSDLKSWIGGDSIQHDFGHGQQCFLGRRYMVEIQRGKKVQDKRRGIK